MTEETTAQTVKQFKGLLIAFGILNIILGFIAMGAPFIAGTVVTIIIGVMLIISGIVELVHAFSGEGWKTGIFDFIVGLFSIIGGGIIIANPLIGLATLTVVLIAWFIADGIIKSIVAFNVKPTPGWGLLLTGGIISILLGIMIWRHWPFSGLVAVGILVGVRILFSGFTMLTMGTAINSSAIIEE